MNYRHSPSPSHFWTLVLMATAMTAGSAFAAGNAVSAESQSRYQRDVAVCESAPPGTDKAACVREAGAVREGNRSVELKSDPANYASNALKRCEPLPDADRAACVARIEGEGTSRGSVSGGGIFRELTTVEGVPQASPGTSAAPNQ